VTYLMSSCKTFRGKLFYHYQKRGTEAQTHQGESLTPHQSPHPFFPPLTDIHY
jgi:hypothetical protein